MTSTTERNQTIISIAADGYAASIECTDLPPSAAELTEMLRCHGVVFGLRPDLDRSISESVGGHRPVVIAEGERPVPGSDGYVEFGAVEDSSPAESRRRVQTVCGVEIRSVRKGERVAFVRPPSAGRDGKRVDGGPIAAPDGKAATPRLGSNVLPDVSDTASIVAAIDGNAVLRADGTIDVEPLVTLPGDITCACGPVEFAGSLVVAGDIKGGAKVTTGGDLEVRGNIEDAVIECRGDVIVRHGFVGKGHGSITSGGNVQIQHLVNQTVVNAKDIIIETEAVCAKLTAGGMIRAPHATFVGGVLKAKGGADVGHLGNGEEIQAKVFLGDRLALTDRCAELDKEREHVDRQLTEVKTGVYRLVRLQLDSGSLTQEQQDLLQRLKQIQERLPSSLERIDEERAAVRVKLQNVHHEQLVVHGTVYPNVMIDINGARIITQNALTAVLFIETGGRIQACGK